jgi:3-hydroxyacyl-CoA dehydrogenase
MSQVGYTRTGEVGVITVDNPPVNALGQAVRAGLLHCIRAADGDAAAKAVVILCAGRTFIAGADIKEFDGPMGPPGMEEVFAAIEGCRKPVVAAIHGTALGAGVELALACHYRCAVAPARLGLPELTLGIIPGAGGTQRLPRLIGAAKALRFIIDAKPAAAKDAAALGIVDRIIEGDLAAGAVSWAAELARAGAPLRVTSKLPVDTTGFDEKFMDECRKTAAKSMRGQRAPERAIEAVTAAAELDFPAGLHRESEIAAQTLQSIESKALRHAFFAEREVSKIPGLDASVVPLPVRKVGIVGSGTMGGGIAMNFANIGVPVTILDVSKEALERGLGAVRRNYEVSVKRGRMTAAEVEERMKLIAADTDYGRLADADLVIEAVFEDMGLKKKIFSTLSAACRDDAILATNTSTLDIDEIAASIPRPQQVAGLHFFSPANVMRLVEIVRGKRTAPQVLATCVDVSKKIRKVGVVVGVCHGFVGNRMMLEGYFREADQLLLEGASPEQVDRVMYDFGFAMGPCAVGDMAGLDIGWKARIAANAAQNRRPPYHAANDALAAKGWHGQKTGSGFYRYEPGDRTPKPNPEAEAVIAAEAQRLGVRRRGTIDDREILERCVFSLINEGAKILEEGIAYRSGDIDVIWLNGYGFPRFRGGPMFHADTVGVKHVHDAVLKYHRELGDYWNPAPLLAQLAASGGTFGRWSKD